jgi:hypothetical protein
MKMKIILVLAMFMFLCDSFAAESVKKRTPAEVERPPQFVLLAFDGSSSLDMWRDTVNFASTVKTQDTNNNEQTIKFSYFINPTYYTELKYKSVYKTPALNTASSCIGWASPAGSVLERVKATEKAFANKHEIGSHANSHCSADGTGGPSDPLNGKTWTEDHWTSEFTQFNDLLFNVFSNNKITPPSDFVMRLTPNDIRGFRAPALAVTPGLWPTLKKFNFLYDTSKIAGPNYWPEKMPWGGWNIPLAQIKIADSPKKTLSMDYNWFVFHSAAESLRTEEQCKLSENKDKKWCKAGVYLTPERLAQMKNQVLDSYKYYFKNNYYGNRGPVQIGHHFSTWNGGAYWTAFKEFAQFVCNKPEVKCVTTAEYATWLNSLDSAKLTAYRKGDFTKLPDDGTIKNIAAVNSFTIALEASAEKFKVSVNDNEKRKIKNLNLVTQLQIDFKPHSQTEITQTELVAKVGRGNTTLLRASVVNKKGTEAAWLTYRVEKVGTPEQTFVGPIEDDATKPETSAAHNEED